MLRTAFRRAFALAFLSILGLGACKEGSSGDSFDAGDNLLQYVPADTPYLFATGAPLPDDLLDKIEPRVDRVLSAYQVVLREVFRSAMAKNSSGRDPEEIARMSAIVDELTTLLSIDGMRSAGFERNSAMVFFGNGLLPVLRVSLSDPKLFDAAIVRIEEAAETSMKTAEIDGKPYRYVGDDEGSLIIATLDDDAVFAFVPAKFSDTATRELLGLTLPADNIASTNTLSDISEAYGFTEHYIGFIDSQRIASTFIDGPTGLDAVLFESMDDEMPEMSAVCKQEVRDVVAIVPRMVFGYEEINEDAMSGSFIVELREDIANGLMPISALVPGLGMDAGGLLSMGFSFNLLEIRKFYEGRLDAMENDPFECEYFAELQAGVVKGREILNQPVPPFVYSMRGVNAIIDDIGDFDLANNRPPEDIDASLVFAMDDAQTMVAMGAMFSPELANLNLQPDGKAVLLDIAQVKATGKDVYAAMVDDAVALSVGANAENRVTTVLNADAAEPAPVFSMSMDAGRYYSLIGETMTLEPDDESAELSLEAREALRDAMLAVGELYDRMAVDLRFTTRGAEFESRVTLKD